MPLTQLVGERSWPLGDTSSNARPMASNLDTVELRVVPNLADWNADALRTVRLAIEQSLDGGVVWQPWAGASFRTGSIPRTGIMNIVIEIRDGRARMARGTVTITGGAVVFGIDAEIRRTAP